MQVPFVKYEGTGNDFVVIDNRSGHFYLDATQVVFLCDRKFGIGSDGLILLNKTENSDFEMDYFNSDSSKSFCGNGARCAVHYAHALGLFSNHSIFTAIDGLHEAHVEKEIVRIKMKDVIEVNQQDSAIIMDTGSPHYIVQSNDLSSENTLKIGKEIRFSSPFSETGINVNLVNQISNDQWAISTYERGVENETLSCGTGAVAAAIASTLSSEQHTHSVNIHSKGGILKVDFERLSSSHFKNIWLSGPVKQVFHGIIELS